MPGRKYQAANSSKPRFGFNGKENDNEVKGEGNQQDYGMRGYDPRVARLFSVDPLNKKYPELSTYQFASNRPIQGIDQLGLQFVDPVASIESELSKTILGKTIIFITHAANSAYQDIKSLGEKKTYVNIWNSADFFAPDVSGNPIEYERKKEITQTAFDYVKTAPNWGPGEWGDFTGHLASGYILDKGLDKLGKLKWGAELPEGTVTNGPSLPSSSTGKVPLRSKPLSLEQIRNGCEALAKKIQKSIGGEFLEITPKQGVQLGPVNYSEGQINGWAHHIAVLKDGMVYDGMTGAKGMHLAEYKKMFEYNDMIDFTPLKETKLK